MCGCTPVASDCLTVPRDVLQDGKHGYLISMHDSQNMAKAIISALELPITAQEIKEVIKPFTEEEVIKKHLKVLGFSDAYQAVSHCFCNSCEYL
ncbi:MAG: glycosyltransferase involved in cell wall biosynthesis [Arenicella sp.]|jgi:glycosyltransferase involved in cell wall biosynthesis